jgi:hypothetical protein
MSKAVAKVWTFVSGSNPNKSYETLQYTDGSTSCNCPGWTRRVDANGNRTCKHTRSVHQGTADSEAKAAHDYQSGSAAAPQTAPAAQTAAPKKKAGKQAKRKIVW